MKVSRWTRSSFLGVRDIGLSDCLFNIKATGSYNSFFWRPRLYLLFSFPCKATHIPDFLSIYPKNEWAEKWRCLRINWAWEILEITHAGQPITIATQARIVLPFPYPKLWNMLGAKRGKPKPARDRRHDTAASADAEWRVKESKMYICIDWKFRITPIPTNAIPCLVIWNVRLLPNGDVLILTISVTIQWSLFWAAHPAKNNPTGIIIVPGNIEAVF